MNTLSWFRFLLVSVFILSVSSCTKPSDDQNPPTIKFITTPNHIYETSTVKKGSTFIIGYEVTKSGNDLIHYINVYCSYNGKADTLIRQNVLPAGTGTSYIKDEYIPADTLGSQFYSIEAVSYLEKRSKKISVTVNVQ